MRRMIVLALMAALGLGAVGCNDDKPAGSASMSCSELFDAQAKALRQGNSLGPQANMRMIKAKGC